MSFPCQPTVSVSRLSYISRISDHNPKTMTDNPDERAGFCFVTFKVVASSLICYDSPKSNIILTDFLFRNGKSLRGDDNVAERLSHYQPFRHPDRYAFCLWSSSGHLAQRGNWACDYVIFSFESHLSLSYIDRSINQSGNRSIKYSRSLALGPCGTAGSVCPAHRHLLAKQSRLSSGRKSQTRRRPSGGHRHYAQHHQPQAGERRTRLRWGESSLKEIVTERNQ